VKTEPALIAEDDVEVPEEELAEVVIGELEPETPPSQGFLRLLKAVN